MIVGQHLLLRYRAVVQYRSGRERKDITDYLKGIETRCHIFQNPNYPFPPQDANLKYGVINVDFESAGARDTFQALLNENHFKQRGRAVVAAPTPVETEFTIPVFDPVVVAFPPKAA
jgi:hypothetical protein